MLICAMSDSHGQHEKLTIPECDVLICAGDYNLSNKWDLDHLNYWFSKQPAKHKIFCGGNHDWALEKNSKDYIDRIFTDAIYLEDSSVTIDGVKFYGNPYSPIFRTWAFMKDADFLKENREKIPLDTDVLISHCPPYGILDQLRKANGDIGQNQGCPFLRNRIKIVKPKLHIFGHIHENYQQTYTDYTTDYINASVLDEYYKLQSKTPLIYEY